ncbi:hypothetical protein R70006_03533 [Paraburkholderia domus]|nr:hypothetical protein R70006_03533 [Paraburkholderia domus]
MCTRFAGKGVPVKPIIGVETYGVLTWRGEVAISGVLQGFSSKYANRRINSPNVRLSHLNMATINAWIIVPLG